MLDRILVANTNSISLARFIIRWVDLDTPRSTMFMFWQTIFYFLLKICNAWKNFTLIWIWCYYLTFYSGHLTPPMFMIQFLNPFIHGLNLVTITLVQILYPFSSLVYLIDQILHYECLVLISLRHFRLLGCFCFITSDQACRGGTKQCELHIENFSSLSWSWGSMMLFTGFKTIKIDIFIAVLGSSGHL